MKFTACGLVFESNKYGNDVEEIRTAIEKCRTSAIAEFLSIRRARDKDPGIDALLYSLERTGDFDSNFSYMFLRNVRALCDAYEIEYLGEAGEVKL